MFDAALIALMTALSDGLFFRVFPADNVVTLPDIRLNSKRQVIATRERKNKLNILRYPSSLTFGMIDDYIICDPTFEEESLHDTTFSIVVDSEKHLLGVIRPGGGGSSDDSGVIEGAELKTCIERAKQRATQVYDLIQNAGTAKK